MARKKTVLVADNSGDDFLFLKTAFQGVGCHHNLIHLQDGKQTIDYLNGAHPFSNRRKSPLPDLLLVDAKMATSNGFGFLTFLRKRPELMVTVLMLSGSDVASDRDACAELGAAHFFTKPVSLNGIAQLVETIDNCWL